MLHRVCPQCRRNGGAVCPSCLDEIQVVGRVCGLPGLDSAVVLCRYDGPARRMVLAAKNRGRRDVLDQLAALLAGELSSLGELPSLGGLADVGRYGPPPLAPVVTWIPASRSGVRHRGYDQGQLLARAVAGQHGIAHRRLLARGRGRSQTGRDRPQRLDGPAIRPVTRRATRPAARLMNRSLARRAPRPVAASTVILVDDVITTGASMAAAAGALRSIGVQSVIGLAIAWNASEAEVAAGRVLGADARASTQRGVARRL